MYGTFSFVLSPAGAGPRHQKGIATGTGHRYGPGPLELEFDPRVHPNAPFGDRLGDVWCRDGRCPPSEKKHVPLHPLALSKGINAAKALQKHCKSIVKTGVCCLGRHPSLSKVKFPMKTIKTHRENEGPADEPRIFTRRSVF